MIAAPPGLPIAHPAVTPTRPAKAPFKLMEISGLPYRSQVSMSAVINPEAAERFVFIMMPGTLKALSPLIANSDPPLNPNHPIQSINTPNAPYIILCPGMALEFPSVYFPSLGPTIEAITSAAQPPTAWTTVEPAKSTNPRLVNQPSPCQTQCPEIGYINVVMMNEKNIYDENLVRSATAPETIVEAVAQNTV